MGTVTHSLVVEYIPGFVANFSQIYVDLPARQHFQAQTLVEISSRALINNYLLPLSQIN